MKEFQNFKFKFYLDRRVEFFSKKFKIKVQIYSKKLKKNNVFAIKDSKISLIVNEDEFKLIWLKENGKFINTNNNKLQKIRNILLAKQRIFNSIFERKDVISFNQVNELINEKKHSSQSVLDLLKFLEIIRDDLLNIDKISYALSFTSTINKIKEFSLSNRILFFEVNSKWIKSFEEYIINSGQSVNTAVIYIRNIRTAFNKAISLQNIPDNIYPFGQNKYLIKSKIITHKALSIKSLKSINKSNPETKHKQKAKDFFMFSFYSKGMKIKDIIKLKKSDTNLKFTDNALIKVEDKKKYFLKYIKKNQVIKILINNEMEKIINKHIGKKEFLFNVLDEVDFENQFRHKNNFVRYINQHLSSLAKDIGLTENISSSSAKKTLISLLFKKKFSIEHLAKILNHSSIEETNIYLRKIENQFEDDLQKAIKL